MATAEGTYDFVYVENTGSPDDEDARDLEFPIPNYKRAKIRPGERKIFPIAIAASAFGDPFTADSARDPQRRRLYEELRQYWGFHAGFDAELDKDVKTQHGERLFSSWEAKRPPFRCTTVEGEYLPMVLDDPDAEQPLPAAGDFTPEQARGTGSLEAVVAAQQRQIEALMAMVQNQALTNAANPTPPPSDAAAEVPKPADDEAPPQVDRPRAVRTGSRDTRDTRDR